MNKQEINELYKRLAEYAPNWANALQSTPIYQLIKDNGRYYHLQFYDKLGISHTSHHYRNNIVAEAYNYNDKYIHECKECYKLAKFMMRSISRYNITRFYKTLNEIINHFDTAHPYLKKKEIDK